MSNLDLLPFPSRDLVDIEQYRDLWKKAHGFFSLNLVASRGCPYRCNWCAKPIYGDSFHARAPENVAAEMLELREVFGADHLWFADDLFGIQDRWVHDLAHHVQRRSAAVPFKMQSRVDLMKEDTARLLHQAGCTEVWMGVESGSQKILDAMENDRDIDWPKLDPITFLTSYAPSLKGKHADRAVEIARAAPMNTEAGIVDRLLGRK